PCFIGRIGPGAARALLSFPPRRSSDPPADLKAAAEAWVQRAAGVSVDFDVEDAMETIDRLALWHDRDRLQLLPPGAAAEALLNQDRKSTRLNSSHVKISYAVFCLKKKN